MKRIGFLLLLLTATVYAGSPLWTFTPLTATTISVPSSGSATIQYLVTNQSSKSHTLQMQPIQGITQLFSLGLCADPFTLASHQSCVLSLNVNGAAISGNVMGGPVVCQQGSSLQCYQPSAQDSLQITLTLMAPNTSLSMSVADLALNTNGTARILTVTNVGSDAAENITIDYPVWPAGTTANSSCGSTLNPGSSCTVTVTPGANATSDCNAGQGSAPTPGIISVNADNAASVTSNVLVLTYGCIFQEGYIFAIDDTTPNTGSIVGTTAALADLSSTVWGAVCTSTNATSLTDGLANTVLIETVDTGSTAAKSCTQFNIDSSGNSPCATGTCYTDWYLPAICQMGTAGSAGCSPGVENIETNLQNLISGCSGAECLSAEHWSSTEFTNNNAWYLYFQPGTSIAQQTVKSTTFPVRCVRDF